MKTLSFALLATSLSLFVPSLKAEQLLTIETVFVGNAGNESANETNASSWGAGYGYGGVDYDYRIGMYEVTIAQYTIFLNAVAASDPYNLWNSNMQTNLNVAGIARLGVSGSYSYSVIGSGDRPITYVSWFDAARFTNWLHNGASSNADTEFGAYTLNGINTGIIIKNNGALWWIPSENEWVKSAYYDSATGIYSNYSTQSNTMTLNTIGSEGGANFFDGDYATTQLGTYSTSQNYLTDAGSYPTSSFYGTYDQSGNVWEWNDAVVFSSRGIRGGSWGIPAFGASTRTNYPFGIELRDVGFRVASVPETSTAKIMLAGIILFIGIGGILSRFRSKKPV